MVAWSPMAAAEHDDVAAVFAPLGAEAADDGAVAEHGAEAADSDGDIAAFLHVAAEVARERYKLRGELLASHVR